MSTKRTISVQLIVDPGGNSNIMLNEAIAAHLEKRGFRAAIPHIYPDEPLVIEIVEPIDQL